jgi:hypothetical protein
VRVIINLVFGVNENSNQRIQQNFEARTSIEFAEVSRREIARMAVRAVCDTGRGGVNGKGHRAFDLDAVAIAQRPGSSWDSTESRSMMRRRNSPADRLPKDWKPRS